MGEKESLRARVAAALADRYRVERVLGQGGMGVVFLAQDLKHDRPVALKVLRPDILAPVLTGRFLHEIKLAGSLTHPHIVPLFDSGAADGILYYVMPYLTGETLRERLNRETTLPIAEAVRLAREILGALDYAHRQNVVHRDVKPENILLQDGHALVCDFGVARAISAAGGRGRVSGQRSAVGTPDYMSPEQATASAEIDGRSDVYSFGCVLYEMLAGRPPFTGTTPEELMGAQVADRPPLVTQVRHDVPAALSQAVQRALAKAPDERHSGAAAFSAAIDAAVAPVESAARRRWWLGAAAAIGAVIAAVVFLAYPTVAGAGLDAQRYVVLPFRHRGGAGPSLINGDLCELLLYHGFRRWRDVRLSDDLAVHDALARLGKPLETLGDARAVARRVGAGLLVWGEIVAVGDSIQVNAVLYDVRRGSAMRQQQTRLGPALGDVGATFRVLADSLLLAGSVRTTGPGQPPPTAFIGAWLAYDSAHRAIAQWDLARAESAFSHAAAQDTGFAEASLWLAQVRNWRGARPDEWGSAATRAAAPDRLLPRDRERAEALGALATNRQDVACERYRRLVTTDSLDFGAWYGLGECNARDRVVLADAASPTGFRFRGSYHTAAQAYARAFRINPSAHRAFYQRVPQLLYLTEPTYLRTGTPAAPDTGWFAAFPELSGDTIAFVPDRFATVVRDRTNRAPGRLAAVAANRALQLDVTRRWTEAFPDSPDAHEAYGAVLEAAGRAGSRSGDPSALSEAQRARTMATDADQRLRLAIVETRLRLKTEDFEGARRLADSTIGTASSPAAAELQAGLAALLGRANRAAALSRMAAVDTPRANTGEPMIVPPAQRQASAALLAFAALGGPADSVSRLSASLERYVESVRPDRRAAAHSALLDRAVGVGYPDLTGAEAHRAPSRGSYLLDLQAAAGRGESGAVRAGLGHIWSLRGGLPAGDVALTGTYQEARLLLALRDTSGAIRHLDAVLMNLGTVRSDVVPDVAQTGSLLRAMALRAELAGAVGDSTTARWWAGNVATLWSGGDAPQREVVQRLRRVAGGN